MYFQCRTEKCAFIKALRISLILKQDQADMDTELPGNDNSSDLEGLPDVLSGDNALFPSRIQNLRKFCNIINQQMVKFYFTDCSFLAPV
jgi:hypothetical protein